MDDDIDDAYYAGFQDGYNGMPDNNPYSMGYHWFLWLAYENGYSSGCKS